MILAGSLTIKHREVFSFVSPLPSSLTVKEPLSKALTPGCYSGADGGHANDMQDASPADVTRHEQQLRPIRRRDEFISSSPSAAREFALDGALHLQMTAPFL